MDYQQRAHSWYERGLTEGDPFVKFVLFFIALEVLLKMEGQSIHSLRQKKDLLKSIELKTRTELKTALDERPHLNMDPHGNHHWSGKLENVEDLNGMVDFLARARNNLFHGDKGLDEDRDLFIVEYGNRLLEPILTNLLTN